MQNLNTKEIYQSVLIDCPTGITGQPLYTGIEEVKFGGAISLYPNPASGTFNITVPAAMPASYTWTIVDQRGVAIRTGDFNGTIDGIKTIDIADFVSGMYLVNIGSGRNQTIHRKLIVLTK